MLRLTISHHISQKIILLSLQTNTTTTNVHLCWMFIYVKLCCFVITIRWLVLLRYTLCKSWFFNILVWRFERVWKNLLLLFVILACPLESLQQCVANNSCKEHGCNTNNALWYEQQYIDNMLYSIIYLLLHAHQFDPNDRFFVYWCASSSKKWSDKA